MRPESMFRAFPRAFLLLFVALLLPGTQACPSDSDGDGWTVEQGDCNDADPDIYPGAEEVCDGIDNDCDDGQPDGGIDEGVLPYWYPDRDGDGAGPSDEEVPSCTPLDGYVSTGGDCDDMDPARRPDAVEACDGIDNDCDGEIDETSLAQTWYPDLDRDGFGDQTSPSCLELPGYIQVRGDCDDADAAVHPGATDRTGDGKDSDCGGTDAAQPHVGLSSASYSSLQLALNAAGAGTTLWVGPGTYDTVNLSFAGKTLLLASTHGARKSFLDAGEAGSVAVFMTGEGPDSVLDGFTLRHGAATDGGGLEIEGASPTLRNLLVSDNVAEIHGGGLYIDSGDPELAYVTFSKNFAEFGGGMFTVSWSSSDPEPHPRLTDVTFADNHATITGGGLYVDNGAPELLRVRFIANTSDMDGGGMSISNSMDPILTNVLFAGNRADYGGGIDIAAMAAPSLTNVTFVANGAAHRGGGVYANTWEGYPRPILRNVLFAYNIGYNLYVAADDADPEPIDMHWSNLYNPPSLFNHNLADPDITNTELEPEFVTYTREGNAGYDDYHLHATSPLRNGGDSSMPDTDGTASEVGAFGGPLADGSYYLDADADSLYDGWERNHGLDPEVADAGLDPDHDGLDNATEFQGTTDPQDDDTDGDGYSDGQETTFRSGPTDWYSRPQQPEPAVARVPEDFDTIQAALDAVETEGAIDVGAGTWPEALWILGKEVALTGRVGASSTLLQPADGRPVSAREATLELRGFQVTGGDGLRYGGGIVLSEVQGALEDLEVYGNEADDGAGLYLYHADPAIGDVVVYENTAPYGSGGMTLVESNPTMTNVSIFENSASRAGGMYLRASSPTLYNVAFWWNYGSFAGGIEMIDSIPTMRNIRVFENAGDFSGGIRLEDSSPLMTQLTVTKNYAGYSGYGCGIDLEGDGTAPVIHNSILAHNYCDNIYISDDYSSPSPQLSYCDVYNPEGVSNHNLEALGPTNLTVAPDFLAYDEEGFPIDLHLALDSPLIDAGDPGTGGPAAEDPDGSRSDLGIYGGPLGGEWDRDLDGYPDYFWPGGYAAVPTAVDTSDYDRDDEDAMTH